MASLGQSALADEFEDVATGRDGVTEKGRPEPKVLPVWLTWDQSADQLMDKIAEFNAKASQAPA
jgi:hypothetical protein